MSEQEEIKRPKCDICMKRNADIKENDVNFCAKHYDAYKGRKSKT